MKAHISYTSDDKNERDRTEEINSIDDLVLLLEKENNGLIIKTGSDKENLLIEVYDDWRE